ncbi:hypothetical protein MHM95_05080 [Pseudoalteromonas sp. CnMc7-15]|uniref:hypothetical protein n=1 Tax=Pseudoalteromonas TaxID=53246 RepID=UPI001109C953|nr:MULTISPECIES: hypothetical protein [Pseudoalteromonas]MCG7565655.1 hypothetical protein [Pseudoalteromonas sp. CnMc7-15]TLX51869.1 hypothetical protein CWC31_04600 [Pseudoalteromonas ruthenica]TMO47746.1 hypothetical protein CWC24_06325 [Pseudoalteromonas ruthenica]TMO52647.1 hypothetical protein CWC23_01220 [Pseudoalteromonas ruthenica]
MNKLTTLAIALSAAIMAPVHATTLKSTMDQSNKLSTQDVPAISAAKLERKASVGLYEKVDNVRIVPAYLADPAKTVSVQGTNAYVQANDGAVASDREGLWQGDVMRHSLRGEFATVSGNLVLIPAGDIDAVLNTFDLQMVQQFANGTVLVKPATATELQQLNDQLQASDLVKASKVEVLHKVVDAF